MGLGFSFGAAALAAPLSLPASMLALAGGASLRQAADSPWLATRAAVPDAAVWAPMVLNVIWAANLLLLAVAVAPSSKPPGQAAVQLIGALLFAGLGIIGLRRACAIVEP